MAWVTPIGSDPTQIDYRLGLGHGCVTEEISDAQLDQQTDMRERPLMWVGSALADLGIEAGTELTPEQFDMARAVVAGYHPHTGEQLVAHKTGVPRGAKVALAPLVRMIEGVTREAAVPIEEVLTSARMREIYARAQRAVDREGEGAALRADHAGQLADAAGLTPDEVWGEQTFTDAVAQLNITITMPDGTRRTFDNRVVVGNLAYDVTLTLDGSFRAAYGLVDDATRAELDAIYTDQAMATFNWLEGATAYGMRGHHGDGQTATVTQGNGFAGWAMFHRTARPVDGAAVGDPHWHVHYTIANMTMGEDGKWSTIASGGRDLMRHAKVVDKLLQAAVRDVLTRRYGAQFRRSDRTGLWELASISDEAILLYAKRGQGIDKALIKMGMSPEEATKAVRRVAASQTRERKGESTTATDETLAGHWRREAIAAGLDPDQITRDAFGGGPTAPVSRPTLDELATLLQNVDSGLTAHTRRFSRADALAAVADALPNGGTHAEIEQLTDHVLEHAGFVKLSKKPARTTEPQPTNGERRQLAAGHMANAALYTTQDVIDVEKVIVAAAEASHPDQTDIRVSPVTAEMAASTIEAAGGFELSAEQRSELLRITTSGRALDALIGPPGSGKTTLMDAVRAAYQAEGIIIAGGATQGVTAQTLQAESGIPSRTVAQWLWRIDTGPGLRGVDVLVLDEAGMINDRDRARLYFAAAAAGTKIVEIGDPKQLRGVGVGSSFGVVHKIVGGGALTENRRQAEADERAAIAAWRRGDYAEALTSWADRDRLVVTETGQEATAAMLATWVDQRKGAPNPFVEQRGLLMVASTNEMVDRLNDGAQALRAVAGELGASRTYQLAGGNTQTLHEGDHIMIRVNERGTTGPDVLNGYRGVIDTIHDDGSLAVRWERDTGDGRITESALLEPQFVAKGGLNLGYAITIHKSQGMTVGSDGATWTGPDGERRGGAVLFSAAGADNPGSYVAASRHKLAMFMFIARRDVEGSQDEYLLGLPRTAWDRTRRVITKLIDRAKATEINRNDTPVLVDLGLLDDPNPRRHTTTAAQPGQHTPTPDDIERKKAFRAKNHAAEVVRRAKAEALLNKEWGEHPAVDRVIDGPAFSTLARWLDRIDNAGGDPRAVLRGIDPDEMTAPHVRDASRLAASLVKEIALTDPTTTRPRPRPLTKAQRQARADTAENTQRAAAANLLRAEWGQHPVVDRVISGPAIGALAQNLATAAAAGHDPRAILRGIDPDTVARPQISNPSAFLAARVRAGAADQPRPAATPAAQIPPKELAMTDEQQLTPAQVAGAIAALDTWWRNPGGDDWRAPGVTWNDDDVRAMHAALNAPNVDAALTAIGAAPGDPLLSSPQQDADNRATMTEILVAARGGQQVPANPSHQIPREPTLDTMVPAYERTNSWLRAQTATAPEPSSHDAMWPSWLPAPVDPAGLEGRVRSIAEAGRVDARDIRRRVVDLGREAARNRPDWVEQLGPAPAGAAQRARYLANITTIAAYREQHGVSGPDPLGPPPPASDTHTAYQAAQRARQQLTRPAAAPSRSDTRTTAQHTTVPADKNRPPAPAVSQAADEARHRAARIAEQQRQAQHQAHDPGRRSPKPTQGPRPGQ
ncbi:Conjugal transfer protein TraA [Alloactinosynnema sp. L-07]|uniref:MobF family relaxase n=1 Tax=Alloactinosynnema sp. L-07 TaxID=1653480 RepID=UPI00065EF82D|nr:MobF family relaxase [Alloactinosynnema sp. L-07]CRK56988.1 Conjugal transfer protein TraA [Alloactinosynnema sp. L-07]